MPPSPTSFSLQAAADQLGISRNQMVQHIEKGAVSAYFEGWQLHIEAADLADFKAAESKKNADGSAARADAGTARPASASE